MREHVIHGASIVALIAVSALACVSGCASHVSASDKRFILLGPSGEDLFHRCSQVGSQGVTEYWAPSTSDMDDLEETLPGALAKKLPAALIKKRFPDLEAAKFLERYHRQYTGVTVGGEKFVYGNFYPADLFSSPTASSLRRSETLYILNGYDGGVAFFCVIYQLGTRTIERVKFNGTFAGPEF